MIQVELAPGMLAYLRIAFRGLQVLCSALALVFTATGFRSYGYSDWSYTLASPATSFNLLMAYTGTLYAVFQLVLVDALGLLPPMKPLLQIILDGLMAALLLVAGIVMVSSNFISRCDEFYYNGSYGQLRCTSLRAATVFAFLAGLCFLLTLGLAFVRSSSKSSNPLVVEMGVPVDYQQQHTPSSTTAPSSSTDHGSHV